MSLKALQKTFLAFITRRPRPGPPRHLRTQMIFALAGAVLLFAQCHPNDDKAAKSGKTDKKKLKAVKGEALQGGPYEASGVVAVPGTDGVLFVDDNHARKVFWMQLTPTGEQSGAIKDVPLDVAIDDTEGIT